MWQRFRTGPSAINASQGNYSSSCKCMRFLGSVRTLSMYRDRIKRDIAAINKRLSANTMEYDTKIVALGTRTEIQDRMMQALVCSSQQQMSGTRNVRTSAYDRLLKEWIDWVRTAKQKKEQASQALSRSNWTPFPSFDISYKGWANFKRLFQEMRLKLKP